jgi:C1A family cysteine protease
MNTTSTTAAYFLPPSVQLLANYGHAVTVVGWGR